MNTLIPKTSQSQQIASGDFVIWRGKKYKVRGVMNGEVCIETKNKPQFGPFGGPPEAYISECKWLPISRVHKMRSGA